jgi:hypothetical protein
VNDDQRPPSDSDIGSLRSPIRPSYPEESPASPDPDEPIFADTDPTPAPSSPTSPEAAVEDLRRKMERIASEFAAGRINRAQFNAMYGRYTEQRAIIERLIQRNPGNDAWKAVAAPGHTTFLRSHFEAKPLYYAIFQHNRTTPLMIGGQMQPNMTQLGDVLHALWSMKSRPKVGLARKDIGNGNWLILALGEHAVTLVMFMLEPSPMQANKVRDLHADFERANRMALASDTKSLDRMVFPQRALVE